MGARGGSPGARGVARGALAGGKPSGTGGGREGIETTAQTGMMAGGAGLHLDPPPLIYGYGWCSGDHQLQCRLSSERMNAIISPEEEEDVISKFCRR